MPKVMFWRDSTEEGFLLSYGGPLSLNGESSDSALSLSFLPDISPHRFGPHSH